MGIFGKKKTEGRPIEVAISDTWDWSASGGFAVLDVETTGLSPFNDRIIEIALIQVDDDARPMAFWGSLVNPRRGVSATHIHGITEADVASESWIRPMSRVMLEMSKSLLHHASPLLGPRAVLSRLGSSVAVEGVVGTLLAFRKSRMERSQDWVRKPSIGPLMSMRCYPFFACSRVLRSGSLVMPTCSISHFS